MDIQFFEIQFFEQTMKKQWKTMNNTQEAGFQPLQFPIKFLVFKTLRSADSLLHEDPKMKQRLSSYRT